MRLLEITSIVPSIDMLLDRLPNPEDFGWDESSLSPECISGFSPALFIIILENETYSVETGMKLLLECSGGEIKVSEEEIWDGARGKWLQKSVSSLENPLPMPKTRNKRLPTLPGRDSSNTALCGKKRFHAPRRRIPVPKNPRRTPRRMVRS